MTIIYPRNKTTLDFSFYNKYFFFCKLTTIVITFSKTSKISEINAIVEENFLQNTKMPLRGELRQGFSEKQERKVIPELILFYCILFLLILWKCDMQKSMQILIVWLNIFSHSGCKHRSYCDLQTQLMKLHTAPETAPLSVSLLALPPATRAITMVTSKSIHVFDLFFFSAHRSPWNHTRITLCE